MKIFGGKEEPTAAQYFASWKRYDYERIQGTNRERAYSCILHPVSCSTSEWGKVKRGRKAVTGSEICILQLLKKRQTRDQEKLDSEAGD